MSDKTGDERGLEVATAVGGFVGTGLLLQWIGRVNCPLIPAVPDFYGNYPAPPHPMMCALAGANDTLIAWLVGAVIGLAVIVFWEVRFAWQRRPRR